MDEMILKAAVVASLREGHAQAAKNQAHLVTHPTSVWHLGYWMGAKHAYFTALAVLGEAPAEGTD